MTNVAKTAAIITLFGAIPFFASAQAADRILDLMVEAEITESGSTKVIEEIVYDFGQGQHHGIFRNLPTHAQEGEHSRSYGIEDVAVTDKSGIAVPFEVFDQGTYVRIKIGDPDVLVSGMQVYRVSYTATALIRGFPDHDIWEWDVTSSNWPVSIRRARLSLKFPKAFSLSDLARSCLTLPPGKVQVPETCQIGFIDRTASGTTNSVQFMDPELMQPKESMLVQLGFPKGSFKGIQKGKLPVQTPEQPHPLKVAYGTVLLLAIAAVTAKIAKRKYPHLVKP